MSSVRLLVCLAVVIAAAAATAAEAPRQAASSNAAAHARPRLLVLLVADQFRADYVDDYGGAWTGGLRRLLDEGAVFPRARTPWARTRTCTGHASISTGALPSRHGWIDNEWYDRGRRAFVSCTADPTARAMPLTAGPSADGHSGRSLNAPTLADELRRQAEVPSRIVALALKARSAIGLAGQGGEGTLVAWEDDSGAWATSTAFASEPWPVIVDSLRTLEPAGHPVEAVWDRLRPVDDYLFDDEAPGEPAAGRLPRRMSVPFGASATAIWDASPWSDAWVADLAIDVSRRAILGQRDDAVDLLAIGFTALDYVGHAYGPRSHEVQDLLFRLDATLGRLLDHLDVVVGRDRYVVAFTSDHGVAPLPEQAASIDPGAPGGRLSPGAVAVAIDVVLRRALGPGRYIDAATTADVYLAPPVAARIDADPPLKESVLRAAAAVPGVGSAYWTRDLEVHDDPSHAGARASHYPGRSGDLMFLPARHWVVASSGTNHGSPHDYDRDVPIVFFGGPIRPGRYDGATTIDVAPTLADFAGISMPAAHGRSYREVIAP